MLEFLKKLTRKQITKSERQTQNESTAISLDRHLNLTALVFLNVSNSIGSGIYVLTGMASHLYAGPYVSLSYFMSGIACLLSAFCFAEFASRVKSSSGSSYTFIYHSLGEFCAFLMGWMLFIGSLTSIAATSITWSNYLDASLNHTIKNFTYDILHAHWDLKSPFSNYLDIPGVLITLLFFLISLRGIQLTTLFNNTLAILNITLLIIITIGGLVYGKIDNLKADNYPNGFNGIIKGSSVVMYAYLGFESSTYAIEEAKNPALNVPLSMIISVFMISFAYCGSSLSLSLMQPFDQIDTHASFPNAFKNINFMFVIVSLGPIISLMGSLVSSIFATARIAYTMSKDGLLFKCLSSVNPQTKIPHVSTLFSLLICVLLIVVFDVKDLIGFTDITGFLTYSMVAMGLLVVRYNHETEYSSILNEPNLIESSPDSLDVSNNDDTVNLLQNDLNSNSEYTPRSTETDNTFFRSRSNALILIIFIYLSNIVYFGFLNNFKSIKIYLICLIILSNLICSVILYFFEQIPSSKKLTFKVPFVPFLPILVIILNNYLMMASEAIEWIVFGILITTSKLKFLTLKYCVTSTLLISLNTMAVTLCEPVFTIGELTNPT
ncbi:unnamed protein product [Brachionus calyciflorus]|uniref:Cationic amino acid transporter C-terminal domain-containing protein n=1 Tax=Brachionus calyciflorus TaxID=104777 RepID=A0A813M6P7_9BILA|nr:unnamed protein product [Brachionus calyciflorus]